MPKVPPGPSALQAPAPGGTFASSQVVGMRRTAIFTVLGCEPYPIAADFVVCLCSSGVINDIAAQLTLFLQESGT